MKPEKIYSRRKVCKQAEGIDSVHAVEGLGQRRAFDLLMEAQGYWNNMDSFRRERERNRRYCYGQQWKDIVNVDGKYMTEEEYIKEQGNIPLTNNLIRRLVRNVLGVYRSQSTEPTCVARDREEQRYSETMSTVLQCNMQLNRRKDIDARTMEDFLIGGLIVHRKWYGWREGKLDCWTDVVNPNNFFIDTHTRDYRGWDVNCLGEVHDMDFQTLAHRFATTPEEYSRLRAIYRSASDRRNIIGLAARFGYSRLQNYDFLFAEDPSRCRVIEMWRRETKPRYRCHDYNNGEIFKIDIEDYKVMVEDRNNRRIAQGLSAGMDKEDIPLITAEWFVDNYWYYYFLTPFGDILREGETPYAHGSHPYVFKAYPFIDGEIHSFVGDVIDQQRYTNRLITLYDWIIRASAKGVLLFPEDCLPQGTSLEDVAEEWSRFNGVIAIRAKAGAVLPQQVSNNATNIGINELLNLQLKFFEDISGVNGALQGKPGYSGTSAALYNQQTQNATTSLLDLLESFSTFIIDSAYKDVKNIQQYYDQKRVYNIAGRSGGEIEYDPDKIRDIEFDMSIVESTATPAYRAMSNEFLFEIWKAGAITLEQMLEHGNYPFADALLQSLKTQQAQLQEMQAQQGQQGQAPAQAAPQGSGAEAAAAMQAQAQQADPRAMEYLAQYAGG